MAEKYREEGQKAKTGQWGSNSVYYGREPLRQMELVRRYEAMHQFQSRPPENFVSQIAFT